MRLTVPGDKPSSTGVQVLQSPFTRKSPREVAASPKPSRSRCMASPYHTSPGSLDWQGVQLEPSFKLKKAAPSATAATSPSAEVSITPLPEEGICGVARCQEDDFASRRRTPVRDDAKIEVPFGSASMAPTGAAGRG